MNNTKQHFRWDGKGQGIFESAVCCSYIVTNGVIIQREHFLIMSVELNHRFALVLVPLENTADLNKQMDALLLVTVQYTHPAKKDYPLLTCPLCSPSTTIMESHSLFGIMVSSMSCFTSDTKRINGRLFKHSTLRGRVVTSSLIIQILNVTYVSVSGQS